MSIFTLQGTVGQQQIVQSALRMCDFPFERLAPKLKADTGRDAIPVEWADLSRYSATPAAKGGHAHVHDGDDTGHPITHPEFRERVLGLAWYSGKVSLDIGLAGNPMLAREVFLSEGAHMVDFFYMTDADRKALSDHWDPTDRADIDWFDVGPYETWMGEAFMGLFCAAFAPGVPVTMTQFVHKVTPELAQMTRKLLLREAPEALPDPVLEFPYAELDAWAARRRPWWARYSKDAVDAYLSWRTDPRIMGLTSSDSSKRGIA